MMGRPDKDAGGGERVRGTLQVRQSFSVCLFLFMGVSPPIYTGDKLKFAPYLISSSKKIKLTVANHMLTDRYLKSSRNTDSKERS
jgi:hypothetical protein